MEKQKIKKQERKEEGKERKKGRGKKEIEMNFWKLLPIMWTGIGGFRFFEATYHLRSVI